MTTVTTKKLVTKTIKVTPSVEIDGESPTSISRTFEGLVYIPTGGVIYDTASVSINGQEILPTYFSVETAYKNNRFYYTLLNIDGSNTILFEIFANKRLTEYTPDDVNNEATYQSHYGRVNTNPSILQPAGELDFSSPTEYAWFNGNDVISLQFQYEVSESTTGGLSYSENPATYTANSPITENTPSINGIQTTQEYTVSPALPTGLSINSTTGIISGTPTVVTSATIYRVTATNYYGSTIADLIITVV